MSRGAVISQDRLRAGFAQVRRSTHRARHRIQLKPAVAIFRNVCGHRVELLQAGQIDPRQLPHAWAKVYSAPQAADAPRSVASRVLAGL